MSQAPFLDKIKLKLHLKAILKCFKVALVGHSLLVYFACTLDFDFENEPLANLFAIIAYLIWVSFIASALIIGLAWLLIALPYSYFVLKNTSSPQQNLHSFLAAIMATGLMLSLILSLEPFMAEIFGSDSFLWRNYELFFFPIAFACGFVSAKSIIVDLQKLSKKQ